MEAQRGRRLPRGPELGSRGSVTLSAGTAGPPCGEEWPGHADVWPLPSGSGRISASHLIGVSLFTAGSHIADQLCDSGARGHTSVHLAAVWATNDSISCAYVTEPQ